MERGSSGASRQPIAQSALFEGLPKVEEFVPVDDFFDSYVSELNNQGHAAQTRNGNWANSKRSFDLASQQGLGSSQYNAVNVQQLALLLNSRSQANTVGGQAHAAGTQATTLGQNSGGERGLFQSGLSVHPFSRNVQPSGSRLQGANDSQSTRRSLESARPERALQPSAGAGTGPHYNQGNHPTDISAKAVDRFQVTNPSPPPERQGSAVFDHTLLERLRFASQRFSFANNGALSSMVVSTGFAAPATNQAYHSNPPVVFMTNDGSKDEQTSGNSGRSLSALEGQKSKRNPKQQMQNKQAQARYRERQKHKLTEMEQTITNLQERVQLMESLEKSYSQLRARTGKLEEQLNMREQEVSKLREIIMVCPSCSVATESILREIASPQSSAECYEEVADAVHKLQDFLDRHTLRTGNVQGEGLDPAHNKHLVRLVDEAVSKRIRAIRVEGVKVSDLMSVDVRQLSRFECNKERGKWQQIINVLEMIPWQQQNIVALRTAYLTKLQQIYAERQSLNMKAMSYMMPRAAEENEGMGGADEVSNQLQCLSINGYLYASSKTGSLPLVLSEIRENLRSEQKLIAEANYVMLNRVLSAVQAARFIVEAYPHFLDCLALANALAINLAEGPSLEDDMDADLSMHSEGSRAIDTQPFEIELMGKEAAMQGTQGEDTELCNVNLHVLKRQATGCIAPQDVSYGLPVPMPYEMQSDQGREATPSRC